MENKEDYITLKWGILKSWKITSKEGIELMDEYDKIMEHSLETGWKRNDTDEQKEIICKLIDLVSGDIYLHWDGKYVNKEEAKKYVLEYGKD